MDPTFGRSLSLVVGASNNERCGTVVTVNGSDSKSSLGTAEHRTAITVLRQAPSPVSASTATPSQAQKLPVAT